MAIKVDWDKVNNSKPSNSSNSGRKSQFIQLGKKAIGTTQTLRPVGDPVAFYKYVLQDSDGKWTSFIVDDPDACPLNEIEGVKPKESYAINAIDRADGQLKILEGGASIFGKFRDYFKMTEDNPGGRNGADFSIETTGKKGKDYYVVDMVKKTPFTDEEKALISEQGLVELDKIFKVSQDSDIAAFVAKLRGEEAGGADEADKAPSMPDMNAAAASQEIASDDIPF